MRNPFYELENILCNVNESCTSHCSIYPLIMLHNAKCPDKTLGSRRHSRQGFLYREYGVPLTL